MDLSTIMNIILLIVLFVIFLGIVDALVRFLLSFQEKNRLKEKELELKERELRLKENEYYKKT